MEAGARRRGRRRHEPGLSPPSDSVWGYDPGMESVVLYRMRDGVDRTRVMEVYPRHKAYYEQFRADGGGLLALGPFPPNPVAGSMGLFASRADAERFVASDPFVTEGLAEPHVLDWDPVRFG